MIGFNSFRGSAACIAAGLCIASAASAQVRPPIVSPLNDAKPLFGEIGTSQTQNQGGIAGGPGLAAAAAHVMGHQCPNGGWNWPHGGCAGTYSNITAPICFGLLKVHAINGDPAILTSVTNGANHDLTFVFATGGTRFGSFGPAFFHTLSGLTGNPVWSNNAAADFFGRLTAGTYGDPAVDATYFPADTTDWINRLRANRSGGQVNLRCWDFHTLPWAAGQIGTVAQQNEFRDAILADLNLLDGTAPNVNPSYFGELIGLTGAVRGLALNGTTSFFPIIAPAFPDITGIDTLCELADKLASYQKPSGAWHWTKNANVVNSDEDTQTTAYAILALMAAQNAGCGPYAAEIEDGRAYLQSIQALDGGFPSYPGGSQNIESESEAMWALGTTQQLSIEVAQECFNASPVTVQVWARDLEGPVHGYQAFIKYDQTKLAFNSGASSYSASPFGFHITAMANAGNAPAGPGELRIDGNTGIGFPMPPPYTPGATDVLLATLKFNVIAECSDQSIDFDLDEGLNSELSLAGVALTTGLSNSDTFYADLTAPAIGCPDNILVNADAGVCTATLDIPNPVSIGGEAAVLDVGSPHGNVVELSSFYPNPPLYNDGEFSFLSYNTGGTFPLAAMTDLSADYNPQSGCWGCGSPRIQVRVDADNNGIISGGDKNVFVYFGTAPNFTDCETIGVWNNTGNYVTDPTLRWDSSQLGGPFYGTFANAVSVAGAMTVLRVSVITDGGSGGCTSGTGHSLWIDNLQVNSTVVDFDSNFTAGDSCSNTLIAGVRSDALALNAPYPSGNTTITWTATDDCGNSSVCNQIITVNSVNDVNVVIELPGSVPTTRCVHFVTDDCDYSSSQTVTFIDHDSNVLTPVQAAATIQVPCGNWTSLCAKDQQHTLWASSAVVDGGSQYTATSTLVLEAGDTDNDGDVDINDVTWLLFTFADFDAPGGCPWDGTRDADFNNGGAVGSEDYVLLSENWLEITACGCTASALDPAKIEVAIDTRTLLRVVADRVDRNRDGIFNFKDVKIFERERGLPDTLSRKMTTTQSH